MDELNEANINNLTSLWKKMGTQPLISEPVKNMHTSVSWPNRCWFDWEVNADEISSIDRIPFQLKKNSIVPIWGGLVRGVSRFEQLLIDDGFEVLFVQTAMYLNLERCDVISRFNFDVARICSERDIETWTNVAARSFGYEIDVSVILKIAKNHDVQLLLTYIDGQPAATAMLYRTGDIIGVHQVGVLPEYRGKGIARKLMQHVIGQSNKLMDKYIVLQASVIAQSLYKNLGFKQQFIIRNYQQVQIIEK